jgi:carbon storage regulator
MLVLSRKSNESIVIGGSSGFERLLKLTVIHVSGGTVKLGIEVADDVPVHRWEVWERICAGALPDESAFGGEVNAAW